jgi:hypothetical protein
MSDLLKDYFGRDLSDAEFEALGKALEASPEDALRFAAQAEKAYATTGLPKPVYPKKGIKIKPMAVLAAGAFAGALGLAAWLFFSPSSCTQARSLPSFVETQPLEKESARKQEIKERLVAPSMEAYLVQGRQGEMLQVVVSNPQPAHADLRLSSVEGKRIHTLHKGSLAAGRHAFTWAAPGKAAKYRLEMDCGGKHISKMVKVAQ